MKEYFGYSLYSFYDIEKDLVDSKVKYFALLRTMTVIFILTIPRCVWSSPRVDRLSSGLVISSQLEQLLRMTPS